MINAEIKIASFVRDNNIGLIIEDYDAVNISDLINKMFEKRIPLYSKEELTNKYTWENIESILIKAHNV